MLTNLVQRASKLSCDLVEGSFINAPKTKVPETQQTVSKVLNWHLFKGGLMAPDMDQSAVDAIVQQGLAQIGEPSESHYQEALKSLENEP